MEKNLLEIINSLSLSDERVRDDLLYSNTNINYDACDCGCEQDGEGYCMDH